MSRGSARGILASVRARDPGQPLWRIVVYRLSQMLVEWTVVLLYRYRAFGQEHVPRTGPLLIVSSHQSHLDPPLVGVAVRHRHIVPLAREGLFKNRLFGALIRLYNAISLKQDESDTAAMRRAVAEVNTGRALLIFAEGSRTPDGALQPFKPGVWLILKRSRCPVLPVAVEGAFDVWPRSRTLPRLLGGRVAVMVGPPIPHDELAAMGPREGLVELERRIESMRLELRAHLRSATHGRYPAPSARPQEPAAAASAAEAEPLAPP